MKQLMMMPFTALALVTTIAHATPNDNDTSLNHWLSLNQDCKLNQGSVETVAQMLGCGSVHGAVKTGYYSLNHAYFGKSSQDTAVTGGYVKYETAPLHGVQAAVGFDIQRRLDADNGHAEVAEFKEDRDGLAEAYLKWQHDKARVTIGNQRLNLPFMGDYADYRVLQSLYQAADIQYGDKTDFIRATKVNKFKSYGSDEFNKRNRFNYNHDTDGMWAIGVGKSGKISPDANLKGQFWYERYDDYSDIFYSQANLALTNMRYQPEFALQYINGQEQGAAYGGKVDSQIIGAQVSLKPTSNFNVKVAYDRIKPKADAYLNGALLTPYAHNTSSDPIFAQPFFTSTQDLGAGNAYMTAIEGKLANNTTLGARFSYMDLKPKADAKSRDQSEYLLYGIHNFSGKLQGFSVSDFGGVQNSPRSDKNFWQNRIMFTYKF